MLIGSRSSKCIKWSTTVTFALYPPGADYIPFRIISQLSGISFSSLTQWNTSIFILIISPVGLYPVYHINNIHFLPKRDIIRKWLYSTILFFHQSLSRFMVLLSFIVGCSSLPDHIPPSTRIARWRSLRDIANAMRGPVRSLCRCARWRARLRLASSSMVTSRQKYSHLKLVTLSLKTYEYFCRYLQTGPGNLTDRCALNRLKLHWSLNRYSRRNGSEITFEGPGCLPWRFRYASECCYVFMATCDTILLCKTRSDCRKWRPINSGDQ